jgi:hypothetical protein
VDADGSVPEHARKRATWRALGVHGAGVRHARQRRGRDARCVARRRPWAQRPVAGRRREEIIGLMPRRPAWSCCATIDHAARRANTRKRRCRLPMPESAAGDAYLIRALRLCKGCFAFHLQARSSMSRSARRARRSVGRQAGKLRDARPALFQCAEALRQRLVAEPLLGVEVIERLGYAAFCRSRGSA